MMRTTSRSSIRVLTQPASGNETSLRSNDIKVHLTGILVGCNDIKVSLSGHSSRV